MKIIPLTTQIVLISLTLFFTFGCKLGKQESQNVTSIQSAEKKETFYTCPMHPHIHSAEKGRCPICGMPLVPVSNDIQPTEAQLKNANISQYKVIKKNLTVKVPLSGRSLSPQEIIFQVYESDLGLIKTGLKFTGAQSSNPELTTSGTIISIDNFIDPASRTVKVTGRLQVPLKNYLNDGAFHGSIERDFTNAIVIPEESVLHTGTRDLVYVISSKSQITQREVQIGFKSANEYQILSGLTEGEIISGGANFLIDSESKIRGQ